MPAVGLSWQFKRTSQLILVVGRIIIASMIMIEAAGLILYSPTDRAVLENAVAATFVLDIDKYVYYFLVTDVVKERMAAVPPIGVSENIGKTFTDVMWQGYGSYFMSAVLLGAAYALSEGWCNDKSQLYKAWIGFLVPIAACVAAGLYFTTVSSKRKTWRDAATGKENRSKDPELHRDPTKFTHKDLPKGEEEDGRRAGRSSSSGAVEILDSRI